MKHENLKFSCLEDSALGLLSPQDVHLFYYDIGFDSQIGQSVVYCWDNNVDQFVRSHNLVIEDCGIAQLPSSFEENKIFFTYCVRDKDDKAVAFFRHLRNSFAHYRIARNGQYLCMKDYDKENRLTMIGKIDVDLFFELIHLFFEQKQQLENETQSYYYPEV